MGSIQPERREAGSFFKVPLWDEPHLDIAHLEGLSGSLSTNVLSVPSQQLILRGAKP